MQLRSKFLWYRYPEWRKAWWFHHLDLEKGTWKVIKLLSRYQQKTVNAQGSAEDSIPGGCKNQEPSLEPMWAMAQDMQRSSDLYFLFLPWTSIFWTPCQGQKASICFFLMKKNKKNLKNYRIIQTWASSIQYLLPTEDPNSYGKP